MTREQYKKYDKIQEELRPVKWFLNWCGDRYKDKSVSKYRFRIITKAKQFFLYKDIYFANTTVDTLAELEEEGRDKFDELKNYKQLKISVDDTDLELGDIVGGRERITNIYMAAPVIRKIVDVTGRGRTSISYKLKGEE